MNVFFGLILVFSQTAFLGATEYTMLSSFCGTPATYSSTLITNNSTLRAPFAHDYHISNFEIEYNAETKALEIIAKIFIDDLEDGIAASGVTEKLYLCTDRELATGDDYVYAYLSDKMSIKVDGQSRSFNYIGKEVSEDLVAMYCYLEIEDVQSINEITVSNDMLMELFDDQINIVKLKSKSTGKRGFMMLKKGEHSDTVQL